MQLDLKKIPFGKQLSRYMLYEETDNLGSGWAKGLHLALAADSSGGFIGGPMTGPKGFALITPVLKDRDLEYTCEASPSSVVIRTGKGDIRFAIDGTKVLRVDGNGISLRINGRLGFGSIAVMSKRGVEITMGDSIILITARRGKISLDSHWELKALRSTDPVITVDPDRSGAVDLAIYDTDDAYNLPELKNSFDECVASSETGYISFTRGLQTTVERDESFFDFCSYSLWTGFQPFKGMELVPSNKMSDMNIHSIEQPICALPFQDTAISLDIIHNTLNGASPQGMIPVWFSSRQNLYEAVPPVYAYVINRLIENGRLGKISKERLSSFYNVMSKAVTWWLKYRMSEEGLVYYAYRHECNWFKEKIFGAGTPCASPDLAAYIALASAALSKIAAVLGRTDETLFWADTSKKQISILTNKLWNGFGFESVNPLTHKSAPAHGVLTLIPIILGNHLPGTLISAIAEKTRMISFEEIPIIPATMIIHGLKISGKMEDAKRAVSTLLKSCIMGGANDARGNGINAGAFFSPAVCAALLSIGEIL